MNRLSKQFEFQPKATPFLDRISKFMLWRPTIAICNLFLFFALYDVFANYTAIEHDIYGYQLGIFTWPDAIILVFLILASSWSVPILIDRPSTLVLVVVYIFVIIPYQVMALCTGRGDETDHYLMLVVAHLSYFVCAKLNSSLPLGAVTRKLNPNLPWLICSLWVITSIFLYLTFKDIMSFSALDAIYLQRAAGKATNFIDGYLQTYNQYVFSTALVALGCTQRKIYMLVMGLAGAMLNFSISAEKSGLIYPIFIIVLFFLLRSRQKVLVSTSFIALVFSVILLISMLLRTTSDIADFMVWYLGARTLLTPGHFVVLYEEYFGAWGYTNFSHIRGIDLFISVPEFYARNPLWPGIGHIIGEDYLRVPELNANANFIASDGIAGFGYTGVFMIFTLLGFLLRGLDKLTNGIEPILLLTLLLPIALTLTNGSIFTLLTSFGGLFWAAIFWIMFPRNFHNRV
jgi:oligosaccharide repeat unit polymerase